MSITLANQNQASGRDSHQQKHPLDLAKPLLFDCDYTYEPDVDDRLTVKWFRNEELEPFYQWLPQRDSRHLADWIRPLVDLDFVSDPSDPLKRYRSLLIRRLSVNLTGSYTCLVSSLAGQDMRRASLLVYQPPDSFTFEQRIFPPKALLLPLAPSGARLAPNHKQAPILNNQQQPTILHTSLVREQPTQFKNLLPQNSPTIVIRPPNNPTTANYSQSMIIRANINTNNYSNLPGVAILQPAHQSGVASSGERAPDLQADDLQDPNGSTRIVYTHDGRPVGTRRPTNTNHLRSRRQTSGADQASLSAAPLFLPAWMLEKKLFTLANLNSTHQPKTTTPIQNQRQRYSIQLHQFQCQATQVMPKPLMLLTVKRDSESIAQYLHESSSVSIRPFEVGDDYFEAKYSAPSRNTNFNQNQMPNQNHQYHNHNKTSIAANRFTLYDIKLSATIALNVSLPPFNQNDAADSDTIQAEGSQIAENDHLITLSSGIQTVLNFKPNQRMSFECHLELTGTDFEQLKRINLDEKSE